MGHRVVRADIPLNLPDSFHTEAAKLRNKLLLYRFRNLNKNIESQNNLIKNTKALEPRIRQLLSPLLSVTVAEEPKDSIISYAVDRQKEMRSERSGETEAHIIEILRDMITFGRDQATVKEITTRFVKAHHADYERKITPHWIGSILRRKLGIKPKRIGGLFVVSLKNIPMIERLMEQYGLD